MNYAHLHLITNHIPVLGAVFGLVLIAWGLARRSDILVRTAVEALVIIGLAAIAVYFTGEPAEHQIRTLPDFSRELAHEHEEAAEIATIAMGAFTVTALALLWRARGRPMARGEGVTALVGALIVSGMMAYAALLGGRVRHTEIRPAAAAVRP